MDGNDEDKKSVNTRILGVRLTSDEIEELIKLLDQNSMDAKTMQGNSLLKALINDYKNIKQEIKSKNEDCTNVNRQLEECLERSRRAHDFSIFIYMLEGLGIIGLILVLIEFVLKYLII